MSQFSATALINAFIITIVHIRTMVLNGQPILNMGTVIYIYFRTNNVHDRRRITKYRKAIGIKTILSSLGL